MLQFELAVKDFRAPRAGVRCCTSRRCTSPHAAASRENLKKISWAKKTSSTVDVLLEPSTLGLGGVVGLTTLLMEPGRRACMLASVGLAGTRPCSRQRRARVLPMHVSASCADAWLIATTDFTLLRSVGLPRGKERPRSIYQQVRSPTSRCSAPRLAVEQRREEPQ
jgi:hypothetical protein